MAKNLLDLPPEVRLLIYNYVLYHSETDGVISPLPDHWEKQSLPMSLKTRGEWSYPVTTQDGIEETHRPRPTDKLCVLIAGQRYRLSGFGVVDGPHFLDLDREPRLTTTVTGQDMAAWKEKKSVLKMGWEEQATAQSGHDCCFTCLDQPPLTRVCRLVRSETLPCFYGTNHFHFEFTHWSVSRKDALHPLDWWRAIGDTNLRRTKHMSMVFDVTDPERDTIAYGIGIDVSPAANRADRLITVQVSDLGQFPDGSIFTIEKEQQETAAALVADKMAVLAPHAAHLDLHGLHVQGLECMVSDVETQDTKYGLRDFSALTPWSHPHGIVAKCNAVTASIPEMKARLWKRAHILEVGRVVEDILCVLLESAEFAWEDAKYFPQETKKHLERVRNDMKMVWTLLQDDAARDHGLMEEQHVELLRIRCLPTEIQYEALMALLRSVEDEIKM